MVTFLLWAVPIGAALSLILIYLLPLHLIPAPASPTREELLAVIKARNEIRKTAAQLLAGASFVLTFVVTILNFNRDFTQRTNQASEDLFSKSIAQISEKEDETWQTIGAFHLLAELAHDDPKFHYPVFTAMAQYLVVVSKSECGDNQDTHLNYQMSPRVQLIARIFADRAISNDYIWNRFHLDGACLSNVNWLDAVGLQNLWMPNVRLIRADLRNAKLTGSYLKSAIGGLNALEEISAAYNSATTWKKMDEIEQLNDVYTTNFTNADLTNVYAEKAEFQGANFGGANFKNSTWKGAEFQLADFSGADLSNSDLTRAEVKGANFERVNLASAELVGVNFEGVNLKDAKFRGADIADADFTNVKDSSFTPEQLEQACVTLTGTSPSMELHKPKLPASWGKPIISPCPQNAK
jgi:uncharacterized protein YjbI with pentapeptide repeats